MSIRGRRPLWVGGCRSSYWATCRRCWWWVARTNLTDAFAAAMSHLAEYLTRTATKEDR